MVELAVVVTIIGVLTMMAIPRYRLALEKSRVTQAFHTLAVIQSAQERYAADAGTYARQLRSLDLTGHLPLGYVVEDYGSGNWETGWRIVLRRDGASNGYGSYQIAWSQDGYLSRQSSLPESLLPSGYRRFLFQHAQGETLSLR